jgi:hypothetical protein
MKEVHLEEVIRNFVPLPPHPNGRGFYSVLCKVCNDHGKKGLRAGFKFDDLTVGYNCFNCGHSAIYDEYKNDDMTDDMVKVLNGFNIPDTEWKQVLLTSMALRSNSPLKIKEKSEYIEIEPKEIDLPKDFYRLEDNDDKWTVIARDYLEHTREIDPDSHPFYLYKGQDKKWKGRLIIPVYKDNRLIYYQGRSLVKTQKKYMSPPLPKDKVLYGYDKLFVNPEFPLYVVEGWFDAVAVDGIAIFGNQLSKEHIKWLNRSQRSKVIIPDRFGDGQLLSDQAIKLGWSVSTPEIGSCKDMNEAFVRFGKLYLMKTIAEQTNSGFAAQVATGIYCKKRN